MGRKTNVLLDEIELKTELSVGGGREMEIFLIDLRLRKFAFKLLALHLPISTQLKVGIEWMGGYIISETLHDGQSGLWRKVYCLRRILASLTDDHSNRIQVSPFPSPPPPPLLLPASLNQHRFEF